MNKTNVGGVLLDWLWKGASYLPLKVLYIFSDLVLFPITYYLVRYRRKLVRRQLKDSFPEKSVQERLKIEKQYYRFFCDYIVETLKLRRITPEQMQERVEWVGLDALQQRMLERDDYFAFVYIGHLGNWEWLASFPAHLGEGFAGAQIYHPLRNRYVDRMFLDMRTKFGGECIPMKDTLRRILTIRKQGKRQVVGFIADQSPKWESMHQWCTFLHHDTSFFIGTEKLGKQLGAEIYYLHVTRPKRGYYRAEVKFMADANKQIPDYELTDAYARMLEEDIKATPHLWLWTHKRWKRTKEEWLKRRGEGKNASHIGQ